MTSHSDEVTCCSSVVLADGRALLLTGGEDKIVRIHEDASSAADIMPLVPAGEFRKHGCRIHDVRLSGCGTLAVSAARDAPMVSSVYVWRVRDQSVVHELKGPKNWVTSVDINVAAGVVAVSSFDNNVYLHALDTGEAGPGSQAHKCTQWQANT